jgi:hypothetical protein
MSYDDRKPWTAHELVRAKAMRNNNLSYAEIDRRLGRRTGSTQGKFDYIASQNAKEPHIAGSMRAPEFVLAERDKRSAAADLRDQTATFFGDPPPGYSALDRKRAAERPPS